MCDDWLRRMASELDSSIPEIEWKKLDSSNCCAFSVLVLLLHTTFRVLLSITV